MSWIDNIKNYIPDYAEDLRLHLDDMINNSTLDADMVDGVVLAAAFTANNHHLVNIVKANMPSEQSKAALCAATTKAMTNAWNPYVKGIGDVGLIGTGFPVRLRMDAFANHGGTTKKNFEAYSLSASIVAKSHFCIKAHYDALVNEGLTIKQLRDIGRIAAVISAVSKIYQGQPQG